MSDAPAAPDAAHDAGQGVRFSDNNQEIAPTPPTASKDHDAHNNEREGISPEIHQELRDLSISMQKSQLQSTRLQHFAYEPFSLPGSRAPSPSSGSRSKVPSSHTSPAQSRPHSPPLTPSTSHGKESKLRHGHASSQSMHSDAITGLTPQESPKGDGDKDSDAVRSSAGSWIRSRSYKKSAHDAALKDAASRSRGTSPARPSPLASGTGGRDDRKSSMKDSTPVMSGSSGASKQSDPRASSRKGGGIFAGLYHVHDEEPTHGKRDSGHSSGHSMHDLKRFFKFGHKHKDSKGDASSSKSRASSKSGTMTPPHHRESSFAVPFADDHGLESKYGKFGKVLGSGAGGSVRIMKRPGDGMVFAVKQFRERHAYESEKDYNKKVTAEFCVGSTLHHGNIIHMLDLQQEKGHWYMVMEYAPFDLFASVMTGKMSRDEVTCSFMQILSGVRYLHGLGLAHRDLKLDNVVCNEHGIMKIIDFGSAVAYRYPFEEGIVKASGIVGSDPYLAPEVYDAQKYDPEAVDMWSMGIIFCCMALRRFPWKMPRVSDVSYKYFVADPTPGTPTVAEMNPNKPHEPQHSNGGSNGSTDAEGKTHPCRASTPQGREAAAPGASIKGPWRLLRLLPRESRYIVGRMLDTDPKTRAKMDEVYSDGWISTRECCRQEEGGEVIRVPGHEHILEPSGGNEAASKK